MNRLVKCGLALAVLAAPVVAHADDQDVMNYRKQVMKTMGEQSALMNMVAQGKVPGDQFVSHVKTLHLAATYDLRRYGPVGRLGSLLPFWLRGIALDEVQTVKAVERIRPRPLLIVAGTEESGQPLLQELFARTRAYAQQWHMEGAGHGGFAQVQPQAYPAAVRTFFERALGAAVKPAAAPARAPTQG